MNVSRFSSDYHPYSRQTLSMFILDLTINLSLPEPPMTVRTLKATNCHTMSLQLTLASLCGPSHLGHVPPTPSPTLPTSTGTDTTLPQTCSWPQASAVAVYACGRWKQVSCQDVKMVHVPTVFSILKFQLFIFVPTVLHLLIKLFNHWAYII